MGTYFRMTDTCVICSDSLPVAQTILKCGHRFCSECIMDNVARNTGTEEGTSRNKCPMCRAVCCQEVLPSTTFSIRMVDLEAETAKLRGDLNSWATDCKFYRREFEAASVQVEKFYMKMEDCREQLVAEKFKSTRRGNTIRRMREDTKKAATMLANYRQIGSDPSLDNLQLVLHDAIFKVSEEVSVNGVGEVCGAELETSLAEIEVSTPPPPQLSSLPVATVTTPDPGWAGDTPLTIDSPARLFLYAARNLGVATGAASTEHLPYASMSLPARDTDILERIKAQLIVIDKAVGDDLSEWWTSRGGTADDILTASGGGDCLVLRPDVLGRITGIKVGDILSKYGLVKKYGGECVQSQRERLKEIFDLREGRGRWRTLISGWVAEKVPEFIRRRDAR